MPVGDTVTRPSCARLMKPHRPRLTLTCIWSWTIRGRTRLRRSKPGWPVIRASRHTSRRLPPLGSIRSNAGSPRSRRGRFVAALIAAPWSSSKPSAATSPPTTATPNLRVDQDCGPDPREHQAILYADKCGLLTQDTKLTQRAHAAALAVWQPSPFCGLSHRQDLRASPL